MPSARTAIAAKRLRDHVLNLEGPQLLADLRCLAGSVDGLDELGLDVSVSVFIRTAFTMVSRLDASTVNPVDGATLTAAEECSCQSDAVATTRLLMADYTAALAADARAHATAHQN